MSDPVAAEPILPKISLSGLIGLVTASAVAMGIVQQAVTNGQTWAVLTTIALAAIVVPVLMYVGTFSAASLFSTIGSAAMGPDAPQVVYVPTAVMPVRKIVGDGDSDTDSNAPGAASVQAIPTDETNE
ncbi:hypothetical protein NHH03_24925 [Stieleria sp. TO1_6]|uniref:hypothetical protein n=1 Tax=Stieleria tagensis TaxID=2956795 RepID=UPI00209B7B9F|nr:hypothetical protein [Stieleria tagensis]MCO8125004.1 hypothetical protein [Stieleria tagensis]